MIANESLIENILRNNFFPIDGGIHGWVVIIDNRIFMPRTGRFIFPSRQQAVKALYNGMAWKVAKHYSFFRERGVSLPNPPWVGEYWNHRHEYWKDFKSYLGDRLKFVQV